MTFFYPPTRNVFQEDHINDGPDMVSPTDAQLAEWDDFKEFPESWQDDHDRFLYGMVADLREARATLAAVRDLAADMHSWCSPFGVASMHARRIEEVLAGGKL